MGVRLVLGLGLGLGSGLGLGLGKHRSVAERARDIAENASAHDAAKGAREQLEAPFDRAQLPHEGPD